MSRADYDQIKQLFACYVESWKTKNFEVLKEFIDPCIRFNTSTSKTMLNGEQDSLFGVFDFIRDFPKTDRLYVKIYNYVCRYDESEAYVYASVPCVAVNVRAEVIDFFEFTMTLTSHWIKKNQRWMMQSLRQEAIAERGTLQEYFEQYWYFETDPQGRIAVIRGEGDSPWVNMPGVQSDLTELEKIKECIIKHAFGIEWNSFLHCYDAVSKAYHTNTRQPLSGERKKEYIAILKFERQKSRYNIFPVKFLTIEIEDDRARVIADRVRGLKQNSREYEHTVNNLAAEHTCCRCHIEVVKESAEWKIAYFKQFKGLYEVDDYRNDLIYGDQC